MRASLASRTSCLAVVLSAWLLSLQLVPSTSGWFVDGLIQPTRSEDSFDRHLAGREACMRWLRSFEIRNSMSPSRRAKALRRCIEGSVVTDENSTLFGASRLLARDAGRNRR